MQPAKQALTTTNPAAVNKVSRHVDLRNQAADEVLRQAVYLRSSLGRKASLQVGQGGVGRDISVWARRLAQQGTHTQRVSVRLD